MSLRLSTPAVAWVLYDFANTIFSVSILSYFYPLWLGDELGAGAATFNYATAASMLFIVIFAPFFGAIADLRQRRKPYLVALTLISVTATAALHLSGSVMTAVALFIVANFAFQAAIIFYNALLPGVCGERNSGWISGLGGAAGYVSTILVLVSFTYLITEPRQARALLGPFGGWIEPTTTNSNAFLPTAFLFLLFSLPIFFLAPDRKVRPPRRASLRTAYGGVLSTLGNLRSYAGLGTFMLATFLYMDVANTVVSNMALYGRQVFGMEQGEIRNLLLLSTVAAGIGASGFGLLSDRVGPRRTLLMILGAWVVALAAVAAAPQAWALLTAGPLVGVVFGSVGAVSRVMLVALAPPEKVGEFFGFYALAGRLSAVTGTLLTAIILSAFGGLGGSGYRIAVAALIPLIVLSIILMRRVPDRCPGQTARAFSR